MELGLEKRSVELCGTVFNGTVSHEENTEMIVPDLSPDILRIINGTGNAFVREKSTRDGKIDVAGQIKGAVLYIAEGDGQVRKLDISMPFAYVIEGSGITPSSGVTVNTCVRSVDVREINPRKVSVRANVEVAATAYEPMQLELCTDVEQAEDYGIELRQRDLSLYLPVTMKDKSFTISDDIELPTGNYSLGEILTSDVQLTQNDLKIIGNKAIVKGVADIKYLYNTQDGALSSGEHELPFSQIVDIDGMSEDYDLRMMLSVRGAELEPQYDASGDARYMSVNILCDACAIAYFRGDAACVDDVYSTRCELDIKRSDRPCTSLCDRMSKRVAVSETIETGMPVKNVLDLSVSLQPYARRREEGGEVLANDALISAIYTGEDDAVYCASRRCNVVCPLELTDGNDYVCDVSVQGKGFSVGAGNEINARFFADYDITETFSEKASMIDGIELDPDATRDMRSAPSVTIKRLARDTALWDIAKQHNTTTREIAAANNLSDDEVLHAGCMILIPKKR